MEGCESAEPSQELERHLIAAAEHIILALRAGGNLTDGARRAISDLLAETTFHETSEEHRMETEERLKRAEKVIVSWEMDRSMVWDSGTAEGHEYLEAVVEVQQLIESLGEISPIRGYKPKEILVRAKGVLEMAMSRLEEEVKDILSRYKQTREPESVSESYDSAEDKLANSPPREVNGGAVSMEEKAVDLVEPCMIPILKSIAKAMFNSDHGQEFCWAFVGGRRDALHEYFASLELQQLSIEEILQLDWVALSREIRNWVWAMKIVIRVYLSSERNLCDQILGEFGEIAPIAFLDISKNSMLLLLNFGEAIAMSPNRPEKLFGVLDMFDVLTDLLVNIDALFPDKGCSSISMEFHDLLATLGVYARSTFSDFHDSIESNRYQKPFEKGGVHPLTSYTMNYVKTLCVYRGTFDVIFRDEQVCFMDPSLAITDDPSSSVSCPLERHLRSITRVLEANLVEKSLLLQQRALRHIFLMNNIWYMVDKAKDSDYLEVYLGDEWIRKQNRKLQQHRESYTRATWSCTLSLLRESRCPLNSRMRARERCRAFCVAFEEVYKSQSGWVVSNPRIRSELRISTSLEVIHGYRTFLGIHKGDIGEKYIKYTADELEDLMLDFFEGSNKSLPRSNTRKK